METYKLECGCEVPIIDSTIKNIDNLPSLKIDFYNLRKDCPLAWQIFHSGKTKGVFQLETPLGRKCAKDVAPDNLLEAAALISIMRPGCLRFIIDNKSMTQKYCDRKHEKEDTIPLHPALEDVLKETYQILVYQEQTLEIAKAIAGFNLQEADKLRKAMGTKDAKLMASLREDFVNGCVKVGQVGKDDAVAIFDNIEKSNRYAFNKCLHPNTRIMLKGDDKQSYKNTRLKNIKVGDYIFGQDDWVKVIAIHEQGPQVLCEYILEYGFRIRCSENHKITTKYGDMSISDAQKKNLQIMTGIGLLKIKRSKPIGVFNALDLEVNSPNHKFYANNILVSNSHAVEYGEVGYWTAWVKAHFPLHFYTAWLTFAKQKIEYEKEISDLVSDAKSHGINILTPTIKNIIPEFKIEGKNIRFGFGLVKGVGGSNLKKLQDTINLTCNSLNKKITDFTISEFMFSIAPKINKTVMYNITMVGALDEYGIDRKRILFYYDVICSLTDKEVEQIIKLTECKYTLLKSLESLLEKGKIIGKRKEKIKSLIDMVSNPPHSLIDTPVFKSNSEAEFLGCPITSSPLENCLISGNKHCFELNNQNNLENVKIVVEIEDIRENIIKNGRNAGKKMAFLKVKDLTDSSEVVVFSEAFEKYQNLLLKGNTVLMVGNKQQDSLIVDKVVQV